MLSEDQSKSYKFSPCHICQTQTFCCPLLLVCAVLFCKLTIFLMTTVVGKTSLKNEFVSFQTLSCLVDSFNWSNEGNFSWS